MRKASDALSREGQVKPEAQVRQNRKFALDIRGTWIIPALSRYDLGSNQLLDLRVLTEKILSCRILGSSPGRLTVIPSAAVMSLAK